MRMNWMWLLAVPLISAMGQSAPPPGPVQLPRVETPKAAVTPEEPQPQGPQLTLTPAVDVAPREFVGEARPLVIFADNKGDPSFTGQIAMLERNPEVLLERDVVVILDADPAARSEWREWLRPEGFSLVLIDKDGQVKQRKPVLWDTREITRAIDKFSSRRVETGRARLLP